jgi:hypothetical protein
MARCPTKCVMRTEADIRQRLSFYGSRPYPSRCAVPATNQPDGQIFTFAVGQITFRTPAILSPRKGRWPSLPNVGIGLRWTRRHRARDAIAGRDKLRERSQDVLTSGVEAYGKIVWI